MQWPTVPHAIIPPHSSVRTLSPSEIAALRDQDQHLHGLFRQCALAVLSSGDKHVGGLHSDHYPDFEIEVQQQDRGVQLVLSHAPRSAFVHDRVIRGVSELLFSVLRDILFVHDDIESNAKFDLSTAQGRTEAVFHILRNADALRITTHPRLVVCWGGHSIPRDEYEYTKHVGYSLGLRGMDICTGCGPGAMKGPMKGAAVGHAKQRIRDGMYLGITEPGIIGSEAPNPIVNRLVICPDIEKRLEAFVRTGHGIVVFPGGVGTAEELLYLIGILLDPANDDIEMPVVLTAPEGQEEYMHAIDEFVRSSLGDVAATKYKIICGDSEQVADAVAEGIARVQHSRRQRDEAYFYNWKLTIDPMFQEPFVPTHASMKAIQLHPDQPPQQFAAQLRRAFSGIVAGNVKPDAIAQVREHGPFELVAPPNVANALGRLLERFVRQGRMNVAGNYVPSYRITNL